MGCLNQGSTEVTFLNDIHQPYDQVPIPLIAALNSIKLGVYATYLEPLRGLIKGSPELVKAKACLPAFIFTGTFSGSACDKNFSQSSGIVSLDIDNVADVHSTREYLISQVPSLAFCFISPSGTGLKAGIRVSPLFLRNKNDFKAAFDQVVEHVAALGVQADTACSNIARLCYVSHDPDTYINIECPEMPLEMPANFFLGEAPRAETAVIDDSDLDTQGLRAALAVIPWENYSQWLHVGMSLHSINDDPGGQPLALWLEWSSQSEEYYNEDECVRKWEGFVRSGGVTDGSLFHLARQYGWRPPRPDSSEAFASANVANDASQDLSRVEKFDLDAAIMKLNPASTPDEVNAVLKHVVTLCPIERDKRLNEISRFTTLAARTLNAALKVQIKEYEAAGKELAVTRGEMLILPDRGEGDTPLNTAANLRAMLNFYAIELGYNEMTHNTVAETFPVMGSIIREEKEALVLAKLEDLAESHGLRSNRVGVNMLLLANERPFHPVIKWLQDDDGGQWDGVSRIDRVFGTLVEPEGTDEAHLEFSRDLLLKWCISGIACLYGYGNQPPRGVLVLVGGQQVGKTSWFKYLFPDGAFFNGAHLDPKDKDSIILLNNYWAAELGEIDATFRQSDISALKAYIGRDVDEIRRPYAKAASKIHRRTILAGTCNHKDFNNDTTGASRYWPVEVDRIDLDTIRIMKEQGEIRQFWLEIEHEYYRKGRSWQLVNGDGGLLNERNKEFTSESQIEILLRDTFDFDKPFELRISRTALNNMLGIRMNTKESREMRSELTRLGVDVSNKPRRFNGDLTRDMILPPLRASDDS